MNIRLRVPALFALAVACLAALPVEAANKDIERLAMQIATLQSQLSEIQRSGEETRAELKRLSELVAEQNALLRKSAADKRTNDEAMAVGLRELSERVSELAEAVQAIKATFPLPPTSMAIDPNAVPAGGTAAAPAGPGGPAPVPSPVPVAPTGPPPAPRELYSQAYADYARGNYDLAMQGFAEYLRAYPGTDFADNAQYWIGECLYGKKMYAESIEAWNTLLKDFPSSDKLPDARVKKGMALERLGRKSQALVEYRYVVDRYPTSQAARIARERLNP
ncbi:MAG TPA: tol-pal system protein YbgF [Vicinamibacteria bacterium]